jgi:4-hydroxy-tetrahydrodipicolinate reductase
MLKVVIVGAAGRMGQRLVALTLSDPELELAGAVESDGHPAAGRDAGQTAGVTACGVPIDTDIATALTRGADVVIDFSTPKDAVANARAAASVNAAAVIGTTGISEADRAVLRRLGEKMRLVLAPNMSVGVNLLFQLSEQVARALGEDYDIEVVEMHHNQKQDAPSGTAERLGEILAEARGWDYSVDTTHGREGLLGPRPKRQIGMHALRGGDVVGEHHVIFATEGERVELVHRASSRDGFAKGALRAAKFLHQSEQAGCFTMRDVLGL